MFTPGWRPGLSSYAPTGLTFALNVHPGLAPGAIVLRPYGAYFCFACSPRAGARGYRLTPLRGLLLLCMFTPGWRPGLSSYAPTGLTFALYVHPGLAPG